MYQGDIQVAKLPKELRLSLVCWFEAQDAQTKEFTLEISLNGQIITTGQVNLSVAEPESVTLIFPHAPLHLKEEGELLFRLKISEDTSYVAWRGPVRLRPSVKQEQ